MNVINVFVDCHVFDGPFQGSTSYLKGLYFELIQDKRMRFFLASNNSQALENIFGTHANVVYVQYRFTNKFLRLLINIPLLIQQYKIDYAHFQYIVPPIKLCRYIVTTHDVMFLDFPDFFPKNFKIKNGVLFRWSALKSEVVLTVSEYSKERIKQHFGIQKIHVTHNAVDPAFLEPFDKKVAKDYVESHFGIADFYLFVSRFEPRKNHFQLLKTFVEKQHYKHKSLALVGNQALDCADFDAYYNGLSSDIKSKIKIFRKVNFHDLLMFTRAADLSVYPSVAEGFGIPPLESIATETPTICSNTTAMSNFDFLKEFLFDPMNREQMNEKINRALSYNNWPQVKQKMVEKYNWKNAANEYLKAIGL